MDSISLTFLLSANAWADNGTPGKGAPFTGIYAFGDSLTDTGNFFALTGLPPAPYFEGRVSNGIVWIEYLAQEMELAPGALVNYAYAGATTGRVNENDISGVFGFPGLQDEIDFFKEDLNGKKADKRALYVVFAGANDFFVTGPTEETIVNGVANTIEAVQRLHETGVRFPRLDSPNPWRRKQVLSGSRFRQKLGSVAFALVEKSGPGFRKPVATGRHQKRCA